MRVMFWSSLTDMFEMSSELCFGDDNCQTDPKSTVWLISK